MKQSLISLAPYILKSKQQRFNSMILPKIWFLLAFGEAGWALSAHFKSDSLLQALCKTRALSKSRLARPYICLFNILSRLIWPSTCPLLHGERRASIMAY